MNTGDRTNTALGACEERCESVADLRWSALQLLGWSV